MRITSRLATLVLVASLALGGFVLARFPRPTYRPPPPPPRITIPRIEFKPPPRLPEYKLPEYRLPDYRRPGSGLPDYSRPGSGLPDLTFPSSRLPDYLGPREKSPAELMREAAEQRRIQLETRAVTDPVGLLQELASSKTVSIEPSLSSLRLGLGLGSTRTELSAVEKAALAKKALETLTSQARQITEKHPTTPEAEWSALEEGSALLARLERVPSSELSRVDTNPFKPQATDSFTRARIDLDRKVDDLRRKCLGHSLEEVARAAEQGSWKDAAKLAETRLDRLGYLDRDAPRELRDFIALDDRINALQRVQDHLQQPPEKATNRVRSSDLEVLPVELRHSVEDLANLAQLRLLTEQRWETEAPTAEHLTRMVEVLRRAGKEDLARRCYRELSAKALLEGQLELAERLLASGREASKGKLPTAEEKAAAEAMLRDLGALITGDDKGKITTWPVAQAVAERPDRTGHPTRGPPAGVLLLIPEGDRQNWRAPARVDARAGLPPLPEAVRTTLHTEHSRAKAEHQKQSEAAERHKKLIVGQARARANGKSERSAELPNLTYRPRGYSRIPPPGSGYPRFPRVGGLDDDSETAADLVFIRQVERNLGRKLSTAERQQARQYRRIGLSVATVVTIFRSVGGRSPF